MAKIEKMAMLVLHAQNAFKVVKGILEDERDGAAFTIIFGNAVNFFNKTTLLGMPPSKEKAEKWQFLSQKKVLLPMHLKQVSSFQSADTEKEQYPGGVWVLPWGYGTSGFKSFDDEAFSLTMGVQAGDISLQKAEEIASMSGNWGRVQNMLATVKDLPFKV